MCGSFPTANFGCCSHPCFQLVVSIFLNFHLLFRGKIPILTNMFSIALVQPPTVSFATETLCHSYVGKPRFSTKLLVKPNVVASTMDRTFGSRWSPRSFTQIWSQAYWQHMYSRELAKLHIILMIYWWKKPFTTMRYIKPCKSWDKLPVNWCRISSINSISTSNCGNQHDCAVD